MQEVFMSNLSENKKQAIYEKCNGRCAYCGDHLSYWMQYSSARKCHSFSIDHVLPRSRGGSDNECNLVIACHECNGSKHISTPDEYRFRLAMRSIPNIDQIRKHKNTLASTRKMLKERPLGFVDAEMKECLIDSLSENIADIEIYIEQKAGKRLSIIIFYGDGLGLFEGGEL